MAPCRIVGNLKINQIVINIVVLNEIECDIQFGQQFNGHILWWKLYCAFGGCACSFHFLLRECGRCCFFFVKEKIDCLFGSDLCGFGDGEFIIFDTFQRITNGRYILLNWTCVENLCVGRLNHHFWLLFTSSDVLSSNQIENIVFNVTGRQQLRIRRRFCVQVNRLWFSDAAHHIQRKASQLFDFLYCWSRIEKQVLPLIPIGLHFEWKINYEVDFIWNNSIE